MMEEEQAMKEHKELLEKVKSLNADIEAKYDEKIKNLGSQEENYDEDTVEGLKEEYDELYAKISDARKQGKEVFHAGNIIMKFKPLLMMYQAIQDEDHLNAVKDCLKKAREEYDEAIEIDKRSIKNEIEKNLSREKEKEEVE